jgi:hypothetical protein
MDVGQILVTAGVSASMSTLVGVVVRHSVERKFVQATAQAAERKAKRVKFEELKCSWIWAAGRVLYHLVRWAQGRQQPNGDLDNSYARLEAIEAELKGMERGYAAEAQEE